MDEGESQSAQISALEYRSSDAATAKVGSDEGKDHLKGDTLTLKKLTLAQTDHPTAPSETGRRMKMLWRKKETMDAKRRGATQYPRTH